MIIGLLTLPRKWRSWFESGESLGFGYFFVWLENKKVFTNANLQFFFSFDPRKGFFYFNCR